jgi:hypothetical protein
VSVPVLVRLAMRAVGDEVPSSLSMTGAARQRRCVITAI